jgi:hypothetical protein
MTPTKLIIATLMVPVLLAIALGVTVTAVVRVWTARRGEQRPRSAWKTVHQHTVGDHRSNASN